MDRYILTGAPGAGKTSLLRMLEANGHLVVEEAATDVIALAHAQGQDEPWRHPSFIDQIVALQRRRQEQPTRGAAAVQFFDRSPICTVALNRYVGLPANAALMEEVERIATTAVYDPHVFFVRNLGFVEPTAARRISFEDSLEFERVHEESYREYGYTVVDVPRASLAARVDRILGVVADLQQDSIGVGTVGRAQVSGRGSK